MKYNIIYNITRYAFGTWKWPKDKLRWKYLLIALLDLCLTLAFFSQKMAIALPFFIAPLVFVLFLAFFQNPHSFIRQWNGWLVQAIIFSFLLVGGYIFLKNGYFPELNDFLIPEYGGRGLFQVGRVEGLLFVFLATFAQVGFSIGIIFNFLAFLFPNKFGEEAKDFKLSFAIALIPTLIFTLFFVIAPIFLLSMFLHK